MAEKTLKDQIVCFRITEEQAGAVRKTLEKQPVLGIKSVHQFFRKLACDFLSGRMAYKDPEDVLVDRNS
jgi:hypothetical protein